MQHDGWIIINVHGRAWLLTCSVEYIVRSVWLFLGIISGISWACAFDGVNDLSIGNCTQTEWAVYQKKEIKLFSYKVVSGFLRVY